MLNLICFFTNSSSCFLISSSIYLFLFKIKYSIIFSSYFSARYFSSCWKILVFVFSFLWSSSIIRTISLSLARIEAVGLAYDGTTITGLYRRRVAATVDNCIILRTNILFSPSSWDPWHRQIEDQLFCAWETHTSCTWIIGHNQVLDWGLVHNHLFWGCILSWLVLLKSIPNYPVSCCYCYHYRRYKLIHLWENIEIVFQQL